MGLRETKKRALHAAVLKAAERLFLDQGIAATSMDAIAAAAGISRASLFNYYPGKQAVIEALADRFEPRLVQLVQHYRQRSAGLEPGLAAMFAHLARVVMPALPLNRLLFVHGGAHGSYPQLFAELEDWVSAAQQQGEVRADHVAALLAESVYLTLVACIMGWELSPGLDPVELFAARARLLNANLLP